MFERHEPDLFAKVDAAIVLEAYNFCHHNQVETARLLGVTRNVLRGRLAHMGIISGRKFGNHGESDTLAERSQDVASR